MDDEGSKTSAGNLEKLVTQLAQVQSQLARGVASEARIAESETRLRTLIESSVDTIFTIREDGAIIEWNPAAERLFGYPKAEALKLHLTELIPPARRKEFYEEMERLRAGHPEIVGKTVERPWLRKDGTEFPAEFSATPWASERERYFTQIVRDLTERKRAQAELEQRDPRIRFLLSSLPVLLYATDAKGIVEFGDGRPLRDLGLPPEQVLGKPVEEIARDTPQVLDLLRRAQAGEAVHQNVEFRGRVFESYFAPRKDDRGRITGVIGCAIDVTETAETRERIARLAAALEASINAVVITDSQGVIQWVNPAFTRITGYAPEEVKGDTPRVLKSGKQDPAFYKELWQTIVAGKPWSGRLINRRKDGALYTDEQIITPVKDPAGKVTHFIAIKMDVTDQERQEGELRSRNRTLEALYAVTRAGGGPEPLPAVLSKALEALRGALAADMGGVYVTAPDGSLHLVCHSGLSPQIVERTARLARGEGVSGLAVAERRPVILNTQEYPLERLGRFVAAEGIRYVAAAPITHGSEILGSVVLAGKQEHTPFTEGDRSTLQAVGLAMGQMIQRARLMDDLKLRNQTLEALHDVDVATAQTLDMDTILRRGLDSTLRTLNVEAGGIHIAEPGASSAILRFSTGASQELVECLKATPLDRSASGRAIQERRVVTLNIADHPMPSIREAAQRQGLKHVASAPLIAAGQALGAISAATAREQAFCKDEQALLESMGRQLGGAVFRARLHAELAGRQAQLDQRVRELTALNTLFQQQMQQSTAVKEQLASIVERMQLLVKESQGAVGDLERRKISDKALAPVVDRLVKSCSAIRDLVEEAGHIAAEAESLAPESKPLANGQKRAS